MYIFIVNPTAGNGRAKRVFSKIIASKLYRDINSEHYVTAYKGHAEKVANQITEKHVKVTCVIVVGGDGTLHEVFNGLKDTTIPVSFIPGGSGNDFARGCALKGSPLKILQRIINGEHEISYWLGNYQINHTYMRHFVNSMGFGFDAEIARNANKSRYKKLFNFLHIGTVSYVIALIHVLLKFKPTTMELELDGVHRKIPDCWMVTIANHPFYGGGMKIIPRAQVQPHVFSVLIIHSISKWKVLGLFMTVFTGKHVHFKELELVEANTLTIRSENEIQYQVDGQTDTCTSCTLSKKGHPIRVIGSEQKKQ